MERRKIKVLVVEAATVAIRLGLVDNGPETARGTTRTRDPR